VAFRLSFRRCVRGHVTRAAEWYEEQRLGLGRQFLIAVDKVLGQIRQQPLRYGLVGRGTRRAYVRPFAYSIFFRVKDDHVVVVGVLHDRRDPRARQLLREDPPIYSSLAA
jgi:plasmid stabilization system protein ParE